MSKGYLFKRGSIYYLRRTLAGKRVTTSLGVTTKAEAERARSRILDTAERQQVVQGVVQVGRAWSIFAQSLCRKECSGATLVGYEAQWGRFASKMTDSQDLALVTREQVSVYLTGLSGSVGANTWNKHLNCLKYVWKVVQLDTGATLPDVFLGIQPRNVPLVRHEAFTTAQIQALYDGADGEMRDIIAVAAHTGLRRVDVVNIRKDALSPVDGLIRVRPEKTRRTSAQAVIAPSALVLAVWGGKLGNDSPYLFPEAQSVYSACPQTFGARFQRYMVKTLGVKSGSGQYGFHSFRHWFRSELTAQGAPEALINAMMCHGQGQVTARYVHASAEGLKDAVDGLKDFSQGGSEQPVLRIPHAA